jgi:hypothetical protein
MRIWEEHREFPIHLMAGAAGGVLEVIPAPECHVALGAAAWGNALAGTNTVHHSVEDTELTGGERACGELLQAAHTVRTLSASPIMTQRAGSPTVASLKKPISRAMFMRRVVVEPVPPAPALFT